MSEKPTEALEPFALGSYWQVRCQNEDKVIGNYTNPTEAQHWANAHVLQTGHTTDTTERKQGT